MDSEVKVTNQIEYRLLYSVPSKEQKLSLCSIKCFYLEHIEWMIFISKNVFFWWLKDMRLKDTDAHDHNIIYSEEIMKANQSKLPQLWCQQSFHDYWTYEQIQTKVQQTAKHEEITTNSRNQWLRSRSSYQIKLHHATGKITIKFQKSVMKKFLKSCSIKSLL